MVNLRLAEFLLGIRIGRPWRCRLLASPLDYKALVARDGTATSLPAEHRMLLKRNADVRADFGERNKLLDALVDPGG